MLGLPAIHMFGKGKKQEKAFSSLWSSFFYDDLNQYFEFYAYCANLSQEHLNLSKAILLQAVV